MLGLDGRLLGEVGERGVHLVDEWDYFRLIFDDGHRCVRVDFKFFNVRI